MLSLDDWWLWRLETLANPTVYLNPLMPNDQKPSRHYTTPECPMTGFPVTSIRVLMQGSFEAEKRGAVILTSSMQCLVFRRCLLMKIGHKRIAKHVKKCAAINTIFTSLPPKEKPSKAQTLSCNACFRTVDTTADGYRITTQVGYYVLTLGESYKCLGTI